MVSPMLNNAMDTVCQSLKVSRLISITTSRITATAKTFTASKHADTILGFRSIGTSGLSNAKNRKKGRYIGIS